MHSTRWRSCPWCNALRPACWTPCVLPGDAEPRARVKCGMHMVTATYVTMRATNRWKKCFDPQPSKKLTLLEMPRLGSPSIASGGSRWAAPISHCIPCPRQSCRWWASFLFLCTPFYRRLAGNESCCSCPRSSTCCRPLQFRCTTSRCCGCWCTLGGNRRLLKKSPHSGCRQWPCLSRRPKARSMSQWKLCSRAGPAVVKDGYSQRCSFLQRPGSHDVGPAQCCCGR